MGAEDAGETAAVARTERRGESDQQTQGIQAKLVFDRATASRLGITSSTIDQTLYDAYGQREVSTMFTQLNQYHVVLEVKPNFDQRPLNLNIAIFTYVRGWRAGVREECRGGSAATSTFRTFEHGDERLGGLGADGVIGRGVGRHFGDGAGIAATIGDGAIDDGISEWRTGPAPAPSTRLPDDLGADHDQSPGAVSGDHAFV